MRPANYFAVMIHPDAPKAFLEVLKDYLHHQPPLSFVFCVSVHHAGTFVEFELVRHRNDDNSWKVQFPVSYILAIADMSKKKSGPGFIKQEQ
jgi:hypothetical protein